jgi:hypothetical protein
MAHSQTPGGLAEGSAAGYRQKDPDVAPFHAMNVRSKKYEKYTEMAVRKQFCWRQHVDFSLILNITT